MSITAAISACAASPTKAQEAISAWNGVAQGLEDLGVNNPFRQAMLIGQCAHESARYLSRFENLNYSGEALWRMFKRHFASKAEAEGFHRQPERIANRIYSDRMGNGSEASGEGWLYRGRGYLQLTGKDNYRIFGDLVGLDLVNNPDLAAEPVNCWLLAAQYCARRKVQGRTILDWADAPDPDVIMVTKGINGGDHGLDDRIVQTDKALRALTNEDGTTAEWQFLLLNAGFNPGPIDGLMGPKTQAARAAAEAHFGLSGAALLARLRDLASQ